MRKLVRKGVNIDKLAQKLANSKRSSNGVKYKEGNPEDKVWMNFQVSKKQKREFSEICKGKDINASAYLRRAVQLLIDKEGDVANSVRSLEQNETGVSEENTIVSKAA